MEVQLTPDQQARLTRIAADQGRDAETLVREAVERLLTHDGWFAQEVGRGIAEADRGELLEQSEVRQMIDLRSRSR